MLWGDNLWACHQLRDKLKPQPAFVQSEGFTHHRWNMSQLLSQLCHAGAGTGGDVHGAAGRHQADCPVCRQEWQAVPSG